MDKLTKNQRSFCMSHIHSKDTSIEIALRKTLWHKGYRYRKNFKELPGTPDIALTKYKIAVFCDSEFWHGKDWETLKSRLLKGSNPDYWVKKIGKNRDRDDKINEKLSSMGWTVIRFWEKEILRNVDQCVSIIEEAIFENKVDSIGYIECSEQDLV